MKTLFDRRTAPMCGLYAALFFSVTATAIQARADDPRALLVGGGPNPRSNQVAIESNVRYMLRLLPPSVKKTVLFANGDPSTEHVLYESKEKELKPGERVLALLLQGPGAAHPASLKFRATTLPQLDGPAKKLAVTSAFDKLSGDLKSAPAPALLYFTGHGSPNRNRNLDNNTYDLWEEPGLTVKELAGEVAKLPTDQPVTLVMVQCYSGAFGNLIFEGGDPQGTPIDRDFAGFFATVKERVAAGCTPALDEAEYHDFTSYFFAALTGKDRVGRTVKGADYNRDGKVTMDEAYCYTLIHDASIDIPICTSDVYLRRMVTTPDEDIFKTPYRDAKKWASPAQRAALEELSKALKLSGEDRAKIAYDRFRGQATAGGPENPQVVARRAFNTARENARTNLFARWPDLRDPKSPNYATAKAEAAEQLERQSAEGKFAELAAAEKALDAADDAEYQEEIATSKITRFVRLFKTVALTHALRQTGEAPVKERLERLLLAESRPFLAGSVRTASKTR